MAWRFDHRHKEPIDGQHLVNQSRVFLGRLNNNARYTWIPKAMTTQQTWTVTMLNISSEQNKMYIILYRPTEEREHFFFKMASITFYSPYLLFFPQGQTVMAFSPSSLSCPNHGGRINLSIIPPWTDWVPIDACIIKVTLLRLSFVKIYLDDLSLRLSSQPMPPAT